MTHAILTGHSRGLGAAVTAELLARGVAVLGLSRSENPALARAHPGQLEQVSIDLADGAALAHWLDGGTLARFVADADRVLLINNAGLLQPVGPLGSQDGAAIARALAVNVLAPLSLANALVAARPAARDCRILHVSSGAARKAYAGWSVYGATKAALDQHARAVAADALPGLRICSLAPGVLDTGMQAEVRASSPDRFPARERFAALARDGQLVPPQDAARRLVAHLLSEDFGREVVADLRELPPEAVDDARAPR